VLVHLVGKISLYAIVADSVFLDFKGGKFLVFSYAESC